MEKILVLAVLSILTFSLSRLSFLTPVEAEELPVDQVLEVSQPLTTQSKFESKLETDTQTIERNIVYKDDPEMELGEEKVLEEGSDGKKTTVTEIYFYEGKEYSREIISTDIVVTKDKIVSKGTKIVWRQLDTPDGQISYWRKMRVYATHYDSRCPGCNDWTATGMRAGKGVIAVDPSVIKLRSQVYIPGYGKAVAGDTGGAIRGNIIDLGFDDARTAGWTARFVDIYLL